MDPSPCTFNYSRYLAVLNDLCGIICTQRQASSSSELVYADADMSPTLPVRKMMLEILFSSLVHAEA